MERLSGVGLAQESVYVRDEWARDNVLQWQSSDVGYAYGVTLFLRCMQMYADLFLVVLLGGASPRLRRPQPFIGSKKPGVLRPFRG